MIETQKTVVLYDGARIDLPTQRQLWEVTISISHVDGRTGHVSRVSPETKGSVHVARGTLEEHGLLPRVPRQPEKPEPTETAEDLILKLLEHVGFYPAE